MYQIRYMDNAGAKATVEYGTGKPIQFSEEEAWDFVRQVMDSESHPRFMWVKEIPDDGEYTGTASRRT